MAPKLRVESIAVSSLSLDPSNLRLHPERSIEAIKASLRRFGQRKPIVVDGRGVVRAGNGVLAAAIALGWTHVDAVRLPLKGPEATAFAIADNRVAEHSTWAPELAEMLKALQAEDAAMLEATGFTETELGALLDQAGVVEAGLAAEDAVPNLPAEPVTRAGDLIELGDHRLLCGDATSEGDVRRLLQRQVPGLLLTDPPYGVRFGRISKSFKPIEGDENLAVAARLIRFSLKALGSVPAAFLCCDWKSLETVRSQMEASGLAVKACIVWDKEHSAQQLSRFFRQHEFLLYSGPYGGEPTLAGDVWQCRREYSDAHPTVKPVALMERAIRSATKPGEIVVDLFAGSGSTLIAAQRNGRLARLIELDPAYCDVIVQRFEEFTGSKAKRPTRRKGSACA